MQVAFYFAGEITQVLDAIPGSVVPLAMFDKWLPSGVNLCKSFTNSGEEELLHALGGGLSFLTAILIFAVAAALLFYKKYQVFRDRIYDTPGIQGQDLQNSRYSGTRVRDIKHNQVLRTPPQLFGLLLSPHSFF